MGLSQSIDLPLLGGPEQGLFALELVHSEAIGLVLSDRDPLAPMASALLSSALQAENEPTPAVDALPRVRDEPARVWM